MKSLQSAALSCFLLVKTRNTTNIVTRMQVVIATPNAAGPNETGLSKFGTLSLDACDIEIMHASMLEGEAPVIVSQGAFEVLAYFISCPSHGEIKGLEKKGHTDRNPADWLHISAAENVRFPEGGWYCKAIPA